MNYQQALAQAQLEAGVQAANQQANTQMMGTAVNGISSLAKVAAA